MTTLADITAAAEKVHHSNQQDWRTLLGPIFGVRYAGPVFDHAAQCDPETVIALLRVAEAARHTLEVGGSDWGPDEFGAFEYALDHLTAVLERKS